MKLAGKKVEGVNVETIVLPRKNGEDLVFKAKAVLDYENFDSICKLPEPPLKQIRGQTHPVPDVKDDRYLKQLDEWAENKTHWMILESLSETPDLEWENVDRLDPSTWKNYVAEVREAGITDGEFAMIHRAVIEVCGLSEAHIKEATESFLSMVARQAAEQSSHTEEALSMQSGEPANA